MKKFSTYLHSQERRGQRLARLPIQHLERRLSLDARETRIAALKNLLKERIVILDGAMGTMLQAHQLDEATFRGTLFLKHPKDLRGNYDVLNITQPHIIQAVQRAYLEAGADIIKTNTFNSNAISTLDYGLETHVHELNFAGARIAREVADEFAAAHPGRLCLVAGSMGPTNRTASMSQDVNSPASRGVTFDKLREVYYEQARGLVEGGVDILLIETVFDTLNAKAALFAIDEYFEASGQRVPVMVSGHDCGPKRSHALRPDHRSVLDFDFAHGLAERGHQLRARRKADAPIC